MKSINQIFDLIISNPSSHSRENEFYIELDKELKNIIHNSTFKNKNHEPTDFGPYGNIIFPYTEMGAINSLDLFGLDEIIIFALYWSNRKRYKKAADIGANIGLHSLLMSKCDWIVNSFEPDPKHAEAIKINLDINNANNVEIIQKAVSDKDDNKSFIRVLGNTTGSHLEGAKENPYGDLEKFNVETVSIKSILKENDFVKMDVEGEEANIILSTDNSDWKTTDMMLEVGSNQNAEKVFHHLEKIGVSSFSQKIGWSKVSSLTDIPTTYKEGSLFISDSDKMNWS